MRRIVPISGCGAKGPACFLVETPDARVLLDLGYGPQPGLWPEVSTVGKVDALLLSHGHRDHAGALSLLPRIGNPPVYGTAIVQRLLPRDVELRTLPLQGSVQVAGLHVTSGRNGHAPGGVWLHIDVGGGLLYMGDYSTESALYAFDAPPAAAVVVLDASYGDYDVPLADALPAFGRAFDEGPVLLPVPAAGRGAEIALHVLRSRSEPPHIDDAIRATLRALSSGDGDCVRDEARDDVAALADAAPSIERAEGVMLAAVADGTSGEAASRLSQWEHDARPAIVFTGYIPPGTPAERLTRAGRARYMRWNVHPRLSNNIHLVRNTAARVVLPAFGDARHFGSWSSAFAPARVTLEGPVPL